MIVVVAQAKIPEYSQISRKEVSDLMMLLNELQEKLLGTELRMCHTGATGMTYKCI